MEKLTGGEFVRVNIKDALILTGDMGFTNQMYWFGRIVSYDANAYNEFVSFDGNLWKKYFVCKTEVDTFNKLLNNGDLVVDYRPTQSWERRSNVVAKKSTILIKIKLRCISIINNIKSLLLKIRRKKIIDSIELADFKQIHSFQRGYKW